MGNEGIIYSQDKERNFTNGVMKANKKIDLILQLPDEIETEVLREFEASFLAVAGEYGSD